MAGVGGDALVRARGDLQGGSGGAGGAEHRGVGAGEAPPDPRGRLAQVGSQRRQGEAIEVTGPNVASKPSRIVFKARRGR
jgi:hypothetical protein